MNLYEKELSSAYNKSRPSERGGFKVANYLCNDS